MFCESVVVADEVIIGAKIEINNIVNTRVISLIYEALILITSVRKCDTFKINFK